MDGRVRTGVVHMPLHQDEQCLSLSGAKQQRPPPGPAQAEGEHQQDAAASQLGGSQLEMVTPSPQAREVPRRVTRSQSAAKRQKHEMQQQPTLGRLPLPGTKPEAAAATDGPPERQVPKQKRHRRTRQSTTGTPAAESPAEVPAVPAEQPPADPQKSEQPRLGQGAPTAAADEMHMRGVRRKGNMGSCSKMGIGGKLLQEAPTAISLHKGPGGQVSEPPPAPT